MYIEQLEERRLLAADTGIRLVHGKLVISGTDGDDALSVVVQRNLLLVTRDTDARTTIKRYKAADVKSISTDGKGGSDAIFVGWSKFTGKCTLTGGDGDDTIVVIAKGKATLIGGAGNDNLSGGNGADMLDAGEGADIVSGGNRNDTLRGGADDDTLTGGEGNDLLLGGTGSDTLSPLWGCEAHPTGLP